MALRLFRRMVAAVLAVAAGTGLLVMVILSFVDVIGRYGFHASVFGASEMTSWLMVAVVFGGIAIVTREDAHITVGLLEGVLGRHMATTARWTRHLFMLGCYGLMAGILWHLAIAGVHSGRSSAVLGIPLWAFSGMGAVLSTLGLAAFAADLVQTRGRPGADHDRRAA
jgi:TRAP-type transport system small permease protein